MEAVETLQYKNHIIKISMDEDIESPREYDNLGNMLCYHGRYILGDKSLMNEWSETYECSIKNLTDYCDGWEEVKEILIKEFKAVITLPLYLYDHSGLTISTGPFSCRWDSGQLGFIYVTAEQIKETYQVKRISKKLLVRAKESLKAEVKTYDDYLRGECYSYNIEDKVGNHVDSCCGFLGDMDYCIQEAKDAVNYAVKDNIKKHCEKLKTFIKSKVGLLHRSPLMT